MKFEASKFYKTRDGRKAYVGAICPFEQIGKTSKVLGWVRHEGQYIVMSWGLDGRYDNTEDIVDLVEEWVEKIEITKEQLMKSLEGCASVWIQAVATRLGFKE